MVPNDLVTGHANESASSWSSTSSPSLMKEASRRWRGSAVLDTRNLASGKKNVFLVTLSLLRRTAWAFVFPCAFVAPSTYTSASEKKGFLIKLARKGLLYLSLPYYYLGKVETELATYSLFSDSLEFNEINASIQDKWQPSNHTKKKVIHYNGQVD